MTTTRTKSVFAPEDLLSMPDAVDYELVDGHLVERHMGAESSAVAVAIAFVLAGFIRARRLGHLFTTDCGYQCFPDAPNKVRKPDLSFIRTGRLRDERPPQGYVRIAPDLAVEVISPGDLAYEIEEKVGEYLAAGVRLIWVVYPNTKTVRIHRPASAPPGPGVARDSDILSGEDVLPGFQSPVSEFFAI
jgi:Uma2 family endonuclease